MTVILLGLAGLRVASYPVGLQAGRVREVSALWMEWPLDGKAVGLREYLCPAVPSPSLSSFLSALLLLLLGSVVLVGACLVAQSCPTFCDFGP